MMGHNISFEGEIQKIIPKLSLLPLLFWSTEGASACPHHGILIQGQRLSLKMASLFDINITFPVLILYLL